MGGAEARRLIFVAGTPSGGTSCVAGVLHHLGVDMGRFMDRPGIRGYTTYEDTWAEDYKLDPDPRAPVMLTQRLRFREYVEMRLARATPGRLAGFKGSSLWWLSETAPETLPLIVVRVVRTIESAIASDLRIQAELRERRPDIATRAPLGVNLRIQRAGSIAAAWQGAREIHRLHPGPEVDFFALRTERTLHVTALADALGLPTEGPKWRAAVGSVRTVRDG